MKKLIMIVLILAPGLLIAAESAPTKKPTEKQFFIFTERGDRGNHYIPSGWMGDYGDLKFNPGWTTNPGAGKTCIQVKYSGERKQGSGWTGIYWQMPANNWGDKRGGYDLSEFKRVTFMARGEKGGEYIDKFMMGGIAGQTEAGDTDSASTDAIELTKEWKTYVIDLAGYDLSHIIGGFGFAMNADMNPNGATFYIDEIQYERSAKKVLSRK